MLTVVNAIIRVMKDPSTCYCLQNAVGNLSSGLIFCKGIRIVQCIIFTMNISRCKIWPGRRVFRYKIPPSQYLTIPIMSGLNRKEATAEEIGGDMRYHTYQ